MRICGSSYTVKKLVIASFFITSACVHNPPSVHNPPASEVKNSFRTLLGKGRIIQKKHKLDGGNSTVNGLMSYVSVISLAGEKNCFGISLASAADAIVFLIACPSGRYYFCTQKPSACVNEHVGRVRVNGNSFELRSKSSNTLHQIEIYPDRLLYRIYERNCLISYPDRKSTRLNSSHTDISRMPSSA